MVPSSQWHLQPSTVWQGSNNPVYGSTMATTTMASTRRYNSSTMGPSASRDDDAERRDYRSGQQHVTPHVKMVLPQYSQYSDDASELATKAFQWQALIG